jgi:signal transduction histidine kinase
VEGGRRRIVAVLAKPDAFPGPSALARLAGRIGLAAFLVLVGVGFASDLGEDPGRALVGTAISLVAAVPLFLFRPRLSLGVATAATAGVVVLGNGDSRDIVWFGLVVLASWCVLSAGIRVGIVYWIGTMLLFGAEWLWAIHDPGWAPWTAGVTISVLATLLIRHEFVLVERLRGAEADLAEKSRIEERSRIARELHDVIAHSLTVSLLHVTSARLAVENDPADAARSLAEAERLGRQSLDEVRATMGLLRDATSGPSSASLAPPVPGLGAIPELVEQLRQAAVDVSLTIDGERDTLTEATGSTIYRIVQEALTNAAKHSAGSPVSVQIEVAGGGAEVFVDSAGAPGCGSGMGLRNMAERADALGGTCSAGPGGSGWLVHASLPGGGESMTTT